MSRHADSPIPVHQEFACTLWKAHYTATYGLGDGSVTWWTIQPIERATWERTAEQLAEAGFGRIAPPLDDITHELADDCPCGPTQEPVKRGDGSMGWVIVHHSLDGRETREPPTPMVTPDGGATCEVEVLGRLDGIAEWCVTHRLWVTADGCPAAPVSSGETRRTEPDWKAIADKAHADLAIEINLHEQMTALWQTAEHKVAAVEAAVEDLARETEIERHGSRYGDMVALGYQNAIRKIRAALAPSPAEGTGGAATSCRGRRS